MIIDQSGFKSHQRQIYVTKNLKTLILSKRSVDFAKQGLYFLADTSDLDSGGAN